MTSPPSLIQLAESPVTTLIDRLTRDQEQRHAWLLQAGEQLRRTIDNSSSRDGERANNASPSDK